MNYRTRRVKCGCCYTGLFLALRQLVVWCCAEFAVLCSTACHVTHTVDHLPYIHPAAATYLPACVCVCVCSAVSACTGMLCLLLGSEWGERERLSGTGARSSAPRAEIVYCVTESPPCLSLNPLPLVKVIFCHGLLCVYKS